MNLSHPLSSLIPTLAGPVLEVLAHTTKPLAGREVLRLLSSKASQQGVQDALDALAVHGLVNQVEAGGSILNTLNRQHILAPFIIEIADLRRELMARLAAIIREEAPTVGRAILFGSVARGEADEHSDIDILLVWEDDASEEGVEENIASRVGELTGNQCNLLHYTASEFEDLTNRAPELQTAIISEGIDLTGILAR